MGAPAPGLPQGSEGSGSAMRGLSNTAGSVNGIRGYKFYYKLIFLSIVQSYISRSKLQIRIHRPELFGFFTKERAPGTVHNVQCKLEKH